MLSGVTLLALIRLTSVSYYRASSWLTKKEYDRALKQFAFPDVCGDVGPPGFDLDEDDRFASFRS